MVLGPGVWFELRMACRSDRGAPPKTSAVVLTLNTAGTTRDSSASKESGVHRREARCGLRPDIAGLSFFNIRFNDGMDMAKTSSHGKQRDGPPNAGDSGCRVGRYAPKQFRAKGGEPTNSHLDHW